MTNRNTVPGPPWHTLAGHRRWLSSEEDRLLAFHEKHAREQSIGFAPLDATGEPVINAPRELYAAARLVHCFAIEHLLGRPGAAELAQHGLAALVGAFHDPEFGGWFSSIHPDGTPADDSKAAYAHAFVLLAGSSATQAGISGGRELLDEAAKILDHRFWREDESAVVDACAREWTVSEPTYRGQNSNMHLTEAYIAAFEATGDPEFQQRAQRIADKLINEHSRQWQWRVPEHFDAAWVMQPKYNEDRPADPFRPYGSLVGHWFEWARLLIALDALPGSDAAWAPDAAAHLFERGVSDGWDSVNGGVGYSVDFDGKPVNTDRMHWVMAEAVGAAFYLLVTTSESKYEVWYRKFWDEIECHLIDRTNGSWWHQRAADGTPKADTWPGKPDLYHAWQATLYARGSVSHGLADAARVGEIG